MKPRIPLHPLILALNPVLSLYAGNIAEASLAETLVPAAFSLGVSIFVYLCFQVLLTNPFKSAIIASTFSVFCFSFFAIYISVDEWPLLPFAPKTRLGFDIFLAVWVFLLGCVIYVVAKSKIELSWINYLFDAVSVCLLGISLVRIVAYELKNPVDWVGLETRVRAQRMAVPSGPPSRTPDIYYIIMDRYAGAGTLKSHYGFDNSEFLDYLEKKGFYVARRSAANYLTTRQSLASSLNFEYLDFVLHHVDATTSNQSPLYELLQDHRVGRFLKARGYQYIHLGSWFEPTRQNRLADRTILYQRLPEMFYALYQTTLLYPIGAKLHLMDSRRQMWELTQRQFADLSAVSELPGQKFVFAHFLLPHEPYVFDRQGNFIADEGLSGWSREEKYVEQLLFANRMLRQTLDKILSRQDSRPIIVLQADEGPWPENYSRNASNFDWLSATEREIEEKMNILNSYYLPGVDGHALYDSISPVNSFRVIFNSYFGTGLKLLPDEQYVFSSARNPYQWSKVGARLQR